MINFLTKILALACEFDLSITSWIRSPVHNKKVGGKPESLHLNGLAVDVILDFENDKEKFKAKVKRIGLLAIDEGDHIHVQIPH